MSETVKEMPVAIEDSEGVVAPVIESEDQLTAEMLEELSNGKGEE